MKEHNQNMRFEALGLSPPILKAVKDCGYENPTPIQAQAIPHVLMTRDVVGIAQTGTGKTAGFILPMIEILHGGQAKARMPRSLVLSPTRELAAQIAEDFDTYGKHIKLSKALLTGGTSLDEQIKLLERGVDVLIATPGRFLDLFERGRILLTDIKILVIDEADRMMDMGFIPDIEKIVSLLPPIRQTLLFSATMPDEIRKLTGKFLSNPKEISVAPPSSPAEQVKQFLVWANAGKKNDVLNAIIEQEDVKNAFIFCNRKRDIGSLTRWLKNKNYAAAEMHGDMSQPARTRTLDDFKAEKISLLICSDVAARGLDVSEVSHVFNYDVPFNAEDYVHRIGRTGRAGHEGRAWTLAVPGEKRGDDKNVAAIKNLVGDTIEEVAVKGSQKPRSGAQSGSAGTQPSRAKRKSGDEGKKKAQKNGKKSSSRPQKTQPKKSQPQKKSSKTSKGSGEGFGGETPAFFGNG